MSCLQAVAPASEDADPIVLAIALAVVLDIAIEVATTPVSAIKKVNYG